MPATKAEKTEVEGDEPAAPKVKRPMSSYFLFMNDNRAKFKEEHPKMTFGQLTKGLTDKWKNMTVTEKKVWEDKAAADKLRYEREMEEAGHTVKSKKKVQVDANAAPKKPQSAYFLFMAEKRETLKSEKPDLAVTQISKHIGEMWKALDDAQKKEWEQAAIKDKKRYEKEFKEFEATGKFTPVTKDGTDEAKSEESEAKDEAKDEEKDEEAADDAAEEEDGKDEGEDKE